MLCIFDLECKKVYKSSLAVGLSGFLEHAVILCSMELNNRGGAWQSNGTALSFLEETVDHDIFVVHIPEVG